MENKYYLTSGEELRHYGVPGMRWGVRRYQKKDGTLTSAGKKQIQEGTAMFPYAHKKHHPSLKQRNRALGRTETYRWEELEEFDKSIGNTYEDYVKKNPNYKEIFEKHHKKNYPHDKHGVGEPYEYWNAHFYNSDPRAKGKTAIYEKWKKRFIEEYATATLDDLNLRATEETRKYAEEWVRKQWYTELNRD